MGECYYLPIDELLFLQEKQVKVSVYMMLEDGATRTIFDGIIKPGEHPSGPEPSPLIDPMVVTTLRTQTIDEDVICYNYTINPNIDPVTFIYNWLVASPSPLRLLRESYCLLTAITPSKQKIIQVTIIMER